MDIKCFAKVQPFKMYNREMYHIIIPKKTADAYDFKSLFFIHPEVLVTLRTQDDSDKSNIIEASDVDKIIANQKKEDLIDKKTRKKLEIAYKEYKDIHDYALQHPDFQEPPYIKKMFEESGGLEKAIQNVVTKARIKEEKEKETK